MSTNRTDRTNNIPSFIEQLCDKCEDTVIIGDTQSTTGKDPQPTPIPNSSPKILEKTSGNWWKIGMAIIVGVLATLFITSTFSNNSDSTTTSNITTTKGASTVVNTTDKEEKLATASSKGKDENAKVDKKNTKKNDKTINNTPQSKLQSSSSTQVTKGSYNYGYATYNGELKNGKPHGKGKLTFKASHSDNKYGYSAEAGDYIEGYFTSGTLDAGATLVKNDGSRKKLY